MSADTSPAMMENGDLAGIDPAEVYGSQTSTRLIAKLQRELAGAQQLISSSAQPGCPGCQRVVDLYAHLTTHLVALSERCRLLEAESKNQRQAILDAANRAFPESSRRWAEMMEGRERLGEQSIQLICQQVVRWAAEQKNEAMAAGKAIGARRVDEAKGKTTEMADALAEAQRHAANYELVRHALGAGLLGLPAASVDRFMAGEQTLFRLVLDTLVSAGGEATWSLDGKQIHLNLDGTKKDRSIKAPPKGEQPAKGATPTPDLAGSDAPTPPVPTLPAPPTSLPARAPVEAARPASKPEPSPGPAPGPRPGPGIGAEPETRIAVEAKGAPEPPVEARPDSRRTSRGAEDLLGDAVTLMVSQGAWTRSLFAIAALSAGADPLAMEAAMSRARAIEAVAVRDDAMFFPVSADTGPFDAVLSDPSVRSGYIMWSHLASQVRRSGNQPAAANSLAPFLNAGWKVAFAYASDALWFTMVRDGAADGRYTLGLLCACPGPLPQKLPEELRRESPEVAWIAYDAASAFKEPAWAKDMELWIAALPLAASDGSWSAVRSRSGRRLR